MAAKNTIGTKTDSRSIKLQIIEAGRKAVIQLIKVAKEDIIKIEPEDELAADRLKNAAATKKLAIFDAFEILNRVDAEQEALDMMEGKPNHAAISSNQGFAERRSK